MTTRGMHCVAYKETRSGARCARFAGGYGRRHRRGYGIRSHRGYGYSQYSAKKIKNVYLPSSNGRISSANVHKTSAEMKRQREEARKVRKVKEHGGLLHRYSIPRRRGYGYSQYSSKKSKIVGVNGFCSK